MPSRSVGPLRDIAENLKLAREFVAGMDWETLRQDRRTVYSVIRCFEIVSEASRRLGEDIKARHSHLPWRALAAAGNLYQHEYERVAEAHSSGTPSRLMWNRCWRPSRRSWRDRRISNRES
jgi:uncharacterized protein with HEPN domain